jgi:hypothetical protein
LEAGAPPASPRPDAFNRFVGIVGAARDEAGAAMVAKGIAQKGIAVMAAPAGATRPRRDEASTGDGSRRW